MADLALAMHILLYYEGCGDRATCEANDPGGWTKFGIAQKFHPDVDVKNLSLPAATEIYRVEYWRRFLCDQMDSQLMAVQLFLAIVNMRQHSAVLNFQAALQRHNVLLPVDGAMGVHTVVAANQCALDPGEKVLTGEISSMYDAYYRALHKPQDQLGWLRRAHWPYLDKGAWPYIDANWRPSA